MTTVRNDTLDRAPTRASDPSRNGVAFTGTSDVTLSTYSRAIYIASDGDLKVDFIGDGKEQETVGTGITFVGLKQGTILPICVSKIYDSDTTVSGVILF